MRESPLFKVCSQCVVLCLGGGGVLTVFCSSLVVKSGPLINTTYIYKVLNYFIIIILFYLFISPDINLKGD